MCAESNEKKEETPCEANEKHIQHKIEFLKYCHERIDELKNAVYQRTAIIMAILAFLVSGYVAILYNVFKNTDFSHTSCLWIIFFNLLFFTFLASFLITAFITVMGLFPYMNGKRLRKEIDDCIDELKKRNVDAFTAPTLIAAQKFKVFEKEINECIETPEKLHKVYILEMFVLSKWTDNRYKNMRRASIVLCINIFAFAFTLLFYFLFKLHG